METMYDRLGDLLSETLAAGQVRFMNTADLRQEVKPPPPDEGSSQGKSSHSRSQPHDSRGNGTHTRAKTQEGSVHTAAHNEDTHGSGSHRRVQPHDAQDNGTHTRSQPHGNTSTRTASQPHSKMSGGTQGEGRHTDTRSKGGHTTGKADGTQSHTKTRVQKGRAHSARAKASDFKAFTAPRVATLGEDVMRALRLLGLTPSATADDVKKAYKEKLKYFHPDRYDKNEVLKTVATKKTRMIVEAYELLSKHFSPEDSNPLS